MLFALRRWLMPRPPEAVNATYIALVKRARHPFFYAALQVPDTLDGRFELIVLHLFLLEHRLVATSGPLAPHMNTLTSKENQVFAQQLSEVFISDMDRSLRELGVADTGVSKRIKKMGKAYHGRLQAYAVALHEPNTLRAALARNLYGTVAEGDVAALSTLADYVTANVAALAHADSAIILAGQYHWPEIETLSASASAA